MDPSVKEKSGAAEAPEAPSKVGGAMPLRAFTPPDSRPAPSGPYPSGSEQLPPDYVLNRELTWLNFNFRVLSEAEDPRVPLLERVKFVAIVSSNLDEFFMKRIGGLKQQLGAGVTVTTDDGRTPQEQIEECHAVVRVLEQRKRKALRALVPELDRMGIQILAHEDLDQADRAYLREYYIENIYPLVTPQSTDPAHPFPFVSNQSLNLLVTLHHPGETRTFLARVKVPVGKGTPRFLQLPGRSTFVTLESVMANNLDLLFPGMEVDSCNFFRVTRNANTEREEETADDLLALIQKELRDRRLAPIVRLEVEMGMKEEYRGLLAAELGLDEAEDVFEVEGLLGMRDLWELHGLDAPGLKDETHNPVEHPLLVTARPIFHSIRDVGSILVHHPYQAYETSVERLLREASVDPKVRAIKMTLYRTSADSSVIENLVEAARNGKQVAVVLELKARFDEAANIRWANRLGDVGIHVTYGIMGLKTHCKATLVIRQDYDGLRRYAHIGTGNYHEGTAEQYSDVGLITCDDQIGRDLTELFNYLTTGYKPKRDYQKILVAPKGLKSWILKGIENEIAIHEETGEGLIQMKMNALDDVDVVEALYEAGRAGVPVDLIVRDSCRLRPGIPGLSESIRVRSIVGRFLEHTRIYYFRAAGDELYRIGSADAMRRNLRSRVEVLGPVERPALKKELRMFLDLQLTDRRNAWEMRSDGSYVQLDPESTEVKASQEQMIEWAHARYKEATRLKKRQIVSIHEEDLVEGH